MAKNKLLIYCCLFVIGVITGITLASSVMETPVNMASLTNNVILRTYVIQRELNEFYFLADRRWGKY